MLSAQGMTSGEAMRRQPPAPPDDPAQGDGTEGAGDESFEICKHADGTFSATHTTPDGTQTPMQVNGYDEAKSMMDSVMGGDETSQMADAPAAPNAPPTDDTDLAGMYARK